MHALNFVNIRNQLERARNWLTGTGRLRHIREPTLAALDPLSAHASSVPSSEVVKAWTDAGHLPSAEVHGRRTLSAARVNVAMRSWR
jgi:hypothetical protein